MTLLEQIDFVFFYIKEHTQFGGSVSEFAIKDRVERTTEAKITSTLLQEIIKRLIQDGFVTETNLPPSIEAQSEYHLTFSGFLFSGYKKAEELHQKEYVRAKFLVDRTLSLSEQMNRLTTWIAIATVIVGLYGILQIVDWFCQHFR